MLIFLLFICGLGGAITKDIIKDGCLVLPHLANGKVHLGFLGSTFIGGISGVVIDGSYLTAFMGGYVGYSVIESLIKKKLNQ